MATNNLPLLLLHPATVKGLSKDRMLLMVTLGKKSWTIDSWRTLAFETHIYQPDDIGVKILRQSHTENMLPPDATKSKTSSRSIHLCHYRPRICPPDVRFNVIPLSLK